MITENEISSVLVHFNQSMHLNTNFNEQAEKKIDQNASVHLQQFAERLQ